MSNHRARRKPMSETQTTAKRLDDLILCGQIAIVGMEILARGEAGHSGELTRIANSLRAAITEAQNE